MNKYVCVRYSKFVKHIWSGTLVAFKCCSFPSLYTLSAKVESLKDITSILTQLWDIIRLFNGEHRAKVIVHCVGQGIGSANNNFIQSFQWSYVVPYYSSGVDI